MIQQVNKQPLHQINLGSKQGGMTLIEIMAATAVVAVLATIAVPSYQASSRSTRRSDAWSAMMQIQAAVEQANLTSSSYPTSFDTGQFSTKNYTFSYKQTASSSSPAGVYTITATAIGDQAKDTCTSLTLDSLGTKGPQGCW